jgi:iron complex transport system substrate-binding protein
MRIASLLPSATEIVCAVGAQEDLVGVSHECDHPPGVERLPVLTRPRGRLPTLSAEIDRSIRELLEHALTVYEVELERLREARPDVIVTQDLCDVCAVSQGDVHAALRELALGDTTVLSLTPTRLGDVWADVRRVGEALGRADRGRAVAAELERRCLAIGERAADAPSRPTVLTIEWLAPVMIGGTWMPELVELAGGLALVTEAGQHAPTLNAEELARIDPDVVLIKPCGFDLDRTLGEITLLRENLPWDQWEAVRRGRVFVADGNAYFNRPGPRLVESLEILAGCLHPDLFADFVRRHGASVRRVNADLSCTPFAGR